MEQFYYGNFDQIVETGDAIEMYQFSKESCKKIPEQIKHVREKFVNFVGQPGWDDIEPIFFDNNHCIEIGLEEEENTRTRVICWVMYSSSKSNKFYLYKLVDGNYQIVLI